MSQRQKFQVYGLPCKPLPMNFYANELENSSDTEVEE
jgi:hypothetical protein